MRRFPEIKTGKGREQHVSYEPEELPRTYERVSSLGIHRLFACFVVLILAVAADPAVAEEYVSKDWPFTVTPYLWALSLDGDVTVKGRKSEAEVESKDILDEMNEGLMIEAEARKNRWGLFVNPLLAQLEARPSSLDVEVDVAVVSFGGSYRLGPWDLSSHAGASEGPKLVMDMYAGGPLRLHRLGPEWEHPAC